MARDRTVLIWSTKDFSQKEHKSVRGNIEFDYATRVCWSPDGKAFIVHKALANAMEVYKVTKRPDGTLGNSQVALTFPQHNEVADILAMEVAVSGKFIMTCNNKNQLLIWSLKGDILETIDTRHGDTYSATLSPCGRFIATTGFTPDVKVWEVKFSKTSNFEGVKRAYDLTGHKAGIYNCSINSDSTRMVSVSKDVEYEKGQLVYLLHTGIYDKKDYPGKIKLSPDGRTVVIASMATLTFFSAITGDKLNTIEDIYAEPNSTSSSSTSLSSAVAVDASDTWGTPFPRCSASSTLFLCYSVIACLDFLVFGVVNDIVAGLLDIVAMVDAREAKSSCFFSVAGRHHSELENEAGIVCTLMVGWQDESFRLKWVTPKVEGNIKDAIFDPSNKLVLTLGDKHVRVFHNVAGYTATIQDLEQSQRKATNSTMRERITQQIKDAKKALENIKKVTNQKTK
ncbi:Transducin beta-like protein 2-like [Homarus americanus]|uniref:Transducin beta-like protein 2-like n=1 Tax=Homarus americanus TaxID=6706 RepID=A0A8J5N8Y1_HOMAM|nr:Transducin beta-like protein 2-like [Homarus americanus]